MFHWKASVSFVLWKKLRVVYPCTCNVLQMDCISGIMTSTEHFVHQNYILVVCKEYLVLLIQQCAVYNCYRKILTCVCMYTHQNYACTSLCGIAFCSTCTMYGTCILHMCGIKLVDAYTIVTNNICTSIYVYIYIYIHIHIYAVPTLWWCHTVHQRCCQVNIDYYIYVIA